MDKLVAGYWLLVSKTGNQEQDTSNQKQFSYEKD